MLEWGGISFSRGSSQPRDQTRFSCIGRWILYHRAIRETLIILLVKGHLSVNELSDIEMRVFVVVVVSAFKVVFIYRKDNLEKLF